MAAAIAHHGQGERVDAVLGDRSQRRHEREPRGQARCGADDGGGGADCGAVGQHDQADVAVGRAERAEHAQGPQAPLRHDAEPGHRHQADEHQSERAEHEDDGFVRDLVAPAARVRCRGRRPLGSRNDWRLCWPASTRTATLSGWVGLAGCEQGELVPQVQRVLDHPDDMQGLAAFAPDAADVQTEGLRDVARHRDLAGTVRVAAGVEAQRHAGVGAPRVLRPQVDGRHRARDRERLMGDDVDGAEPVPDRGEVRGEAGRRCRGG